MGNNIDCIKLIQNIICSTLDWGIPQLKFKDVFFMSKNISKSIFPILIYFWYFGILEFLSLPLCVILVFDVMNRVRRPNGALFISYSNLYKNLIVNT